MTVHVDELTSDVTVEPESSDSATGASNAEADHPWGDEERFREMRRRLGTDHLRTSAEGFDD